MKQYRITFREITNGEVTVMANNTEEAIEYAKQTYEYGDTELDDMDVEWDEPELEQEDVKPNIIDINCYNIDWDQDEDDNTKLPRFVSIRISNEDDIEAYRDDNDEFIADYLSDRYGYCLNSFEYKVRWK